jgi:hypothetical protein
MVKISSETIQSGKFYDGFFNLISHYLANVVRSVPVPGNTVDATPLPMPAPAPALVVTPMSSTPGGNAAPVIMPAPSKEQATPLAAAATPVASAAPVSATTHAHEAAAAAPDSTPAIIESPASDAAALAQ